jgi:hypothetical protein
LVLHLYVDKLSIPVPGLGKYVDQECFDQKDFDILKFYILLFFEQSVRKILRSKKQGWDFRAGARIFSSAVAGVSSGGDLGLSASSFLGWLQGGPSFSLFGTDIVNLRKTKINKPLASAKVMPESPTSPCT